MSKARSLLRVGVAYVVAVAVAVLWLGAGPDTGHLWLDSLLADLLATLVVFGFSRAHHNSSIYDPYWSLAPPLFWLGWTIQAGAAGEVRVWLLGAVVWFWGVRLTANWVSTFPGLHHEDWRYPMLREKAGRWATFVDLLGIHVFPTLQVFLAMVPMYVAIVRPSRDLGVLDWVALLVGVSAVGLEWAADAQMHRFVRSRQPGAVMDRGLWAWSRHPNYLGEIGFWVAIALFGVAAAPAEAWWLFVGVLAMVAMFEGASIPMMERRSLERRPAYADVAARVPRLIPRPPRKAGP